MSETNQDKKTEIPQEFGKIISDFTNDILNTFPEFKPSASVDLSTISSYVQFNKTNEDGENKTTDEDTSENAILKEQYDKALRNVFDHCIKVYPERFFDILYQKKDIFTDSNISCEFLPGINFKDIWICDISDKTRETIWKYLQLVLFTVTININNQDTFGDTANLFSAINEDELKSKLEETVSQMHDMFDLSGTEMGDMSGINLEDLPNPSELHDHINGMLDGKLGQLAREIAEETANEMNMDMEDAKSVNDVFEQLFKNPGKLMGLVQTVGKKLDTKIKSGEIKESELMAEAGDMMNKMKNMPGMDNIQDMLNKMAGKGKKFDMNKFNTQMKSNTQKERMLNKLNARKEQKQQELNHMEEMKKMQEQLEQMQNQLDQRNITPEISQKYTVNSTTSDNSTHDNTNKVIDNSDKGGKKKKKKNKGKKK